MLGIDADRWEWGDPASDPTPTASDVSGIVAQARAYLTSTAPKHQRKLYNDLDNVLTAYAKTVGFKRGPLRWGDVRIQFVWFPIGGGTYPKFLTDIHFLGTPSLNRYRPFRELLAREGRDATRALLTFISLVVVRDRDCGDYQSVADARKVFDEHSARLIAREGRTHRKRREGGKHRAADLRRERLIAESTIIRRAKSLRQSAVSPREWVTKMYSAFHTAPGVTYPSKRTIRRVLQKAHLLPSK